MKPLPEIRDTEVSRTFWKGLSVLEAWRGDEIDLSTSEIASRTGLNRAVARRLIRTLELSGFLEQSRGRYRMTVRVLRLTHGFVGGRGLAKVVQPILRLAAQDIGESVSFSMPDDAETIYVAHAFLPRRFTLNMVTVGTRVPMLPTASGRAILAHLPDEERARLIAASAAPAPAGLERILSDVRANGFCYADGEYTAGVASFAAPVLGADSTVHGAVSVIFPSGTYDAPAGRRVLIARLRQCAADVGATL